MQLAFFQRPLLGQNTTHHITTYSTTAKHMCPLPTLLKQPITHTHSHTHTHTQTHTHTHPPHSWDTVAAQQCKFDVLDFGGLLPFQTNRKYSFLLPLWFMKHLG